MPEEMTEESTVSHERDGHVMLIGLNRPEKRNAFTRRMLADLSLAYSRLDRDPQARCGVVFAHGDHFTAGLDLAELAPTLGEGLPVPEGGVDFLGVRGTPVTKPVVMAVQGWCLTIGIEMLLAADVRIAASDTRFAQIEVQRGILPFGGATLRFARDCGWGNAMRYLLTGDRFGAEEALRIGLVQEVVEPGRQVERAREIAEIIAAQAPLAVQASLRNARLAVREGEAAAAAQLLPELRRLLASEDAAEGVTSFVERRRAAFSGR
jgi:enoyl-CoA hydratase/carnithine racemase